MYGSKRKMDRRYEIDRLGNGWLKREDAVQVRVVVGDWDEIACHETPEIIAKYCWRLKLTKRFGRTQRIDKQGSER